MKVIVTCGPAQEPIDEVRRITNFATGELGVLLGNTLTEAGHDVTCLTATEATWPGPIRCANQQAFTTNNDLHYQLHKLAKESAIPFDAVFHSAALSDFKVTAVRDSTGLILTDSKITSKNGPVFVELQPAKKVIAELRDLFPQALLCGWKYELEGEQLDILLRAQQQLLDHQTDLSVVNGLAYGAGFGILDRAGTVEHCANRASLCDALLRRMEKLLAIAPLETSV